MRRKLALLLTLGLGIHSAFAQEIFNNEDKKQILSSIKDVEITDTLKKTSEYSKCAKHYPPGTSEGEKKTKLKAAQDCFIKEISTDKTPEKLQELSQKLSLQQYGLVQSNSAKEIQSYLNDKLYEALTGVNRREKDEKEKLKSMQMNKMKIVDQSVFIQLYKNQMGKNALAEVSRFCFENLRFENKSTKNSFATHWEEGWKPNTGDKLPVGDAALIYNITDTGVPSFNDFDAAKDSKDIYTKIFQGIQGEGNTKLDEAFLGDFLDNCGKRIRPLCSFFKENLKESNPSKEDKPKKGSAACLALGRIQDAKKAVVAADELIKDFKTLSEKEKSGLLDNLNHYRQDEEGKGIDELTNLTSSDVLINSSNNKTQEDLAQACIEKPDSEDCNNFVADGDNIDKAKHNIELQMSFREEVEKQTVLQLFEKDKESLKKYLEDNGFLDILNDPNFDNCNADCLAEKVRLSFEARKVALLDEIQTKLGKRQVKKDSTTEEIKTAGLLGAQDAKSEKARMTQVVLFHNVISSFLKLTIKDTKESGRNVKAWEKEEQALVNAGINKDLFLNISTNNANADKVKNSDGDMGVFEAFLDNFLK